jgi:hypothetical protein
MAKWYTLKTEDFRYHRYAQVQNFWGTLFYPKEKGRIDLCELGFHQGADEIRIRTYFSFTDILWGLIPGNSVRTVEMSGVFESND